MKNLDRDILWENKVCEWSYRDITEWEPGQVVLEEGTRQYFSRLFAELEYFVDQLVSDSTIPFGPRIRTKLGDAYEITPFAERYFCQIPEFLKVVATLPPQNEYSEHVEVFIACCREMGLFGQMLEWSNLQEAPCQTYPKLNGASAAELFNTLVAKLRERCLAEQTKARVRRQRSEADALAEEYANYADALRSKARRLVVLRIDLEYRKEYRDQMSVVEALADLNHLFNNQRNNSLFKGKLGFIAKLEYGALKALHFHLILFFDGAIKDGRIDVYLAQKIGEYWVKVITKGRGNYWNVNANKQQYKQKGILGIGLIHDDEYGDALFKNLKHRIIRYMCKSTQFVRAKLPEQLGSEDRGTNRRIRRGIYPKVAKAKKKPGRPPKAR